MSVRFMTRCAIFSAVMAVSAWIAVPLGDLAVSLQTLSLFLTLSLLGGKAGSAVCLVYLALGAVGLPVFTGFQGGIAILLGPTGGYLWGFLAAAILYWVLQTHVNSWLAMGLGLFLCYICGTAWYFFLYTDAGLWAVILKCVVPYILPDLAKLTAAQLLAPRLQRILRL